MSTNTPLLQAERVSVSFGGLRALHDVYLQLNQNEVVGVIGPNGAGKTTLAGKLAKFYLDQGNTPLLVASDLQRPNAVTQLQVVGESVGVPVFAPEPGNGVGDPIKVARDALLFAKSKLYNMVIVDTAGRLGVDEELMKQAIDIRDAVKPDEILFVVDSMTGQDAVNTAKTFNERLDFDGVVLTKLDGDSRGGAALSIRQVVEKPIKFISTGEKMEALDQFYPDRMANRILGMGDVLSLVERAQQAFDEDEAARLNKKIRQNNFSFEDFYAQLQQIKKMGNIKDLMGMVPGMGQAVKDVDISNDSFKPIEAIIQSMTLKERQNPDILNPSRKNRIAKGSGTSIQQVNNLLKQFEDMRKMMRMMNKVQDGKMKMPNMGNMLKR